MPRAAPIRRVLRRLRESVRTPPAAPPITPADVERVYRIFLQRGPESRAVVRTQVRHHPTLEALCLTVIRSPEFQARWRRMGLTTPDPAETTTGGPQPQEAAAGPVSDDDTIMAFEPFDGPGTAGFVTDFLGTKTRTGFIRGLDTVDGTVEGYPIPGNFHAPAVEWAGALRAVLDAKDELVVVEVGAGWGPWLTACAAAAGQRGITAVRLVGLEAAAAHCEFMRQHFRDNGLDPDRHTLLHGAAAAADGTAEFPVLTDPAADYGATLHGHDPFPSRVPGSATTRVPAYSIPTLIAGHARVDLLHIDIQGTEGEVVTAAREALKAKVRRLVIGTHGRAIEQQLLEELSSAGWLLETDVPCRYTPHDGGLALTVDGCQVWKNPAV